MVKEDTTLKLYNKVHIFTARLYSNPVYQDLDLNQSRNGIQATGITFELELGRERNIND